MKHKNFIVIGDCEGISSNTIVECLESINSQIIFRTTQCFV